jgi:hypothetical protein
MPNSTARSWRMLLPLAAVLLLALLWTVYWFIAAGVAKTRFAEERSNACRTGRHPRLRKRVGVAIPSISSSPAVLPC